MKHDEQEDDGIISVYALPKTIVKLLPLLPQQPPSPERHSVGEILGLSVDKTVDFSVDTSAEESASPTAEGSGGKSDGNFVSDSVRLSMEDSVEESVGLSVGDSVGQSVSSRQIHSKVQIRHLHPMTSINHFTLGGIYEINCKHD